MPTDLAPLPAPGTRVRCLVADDRPELVKEQVYVVSHDPDLARFAYPANYARYQPDDFRFIAVVLPGQKGLGYFPVGIFEVVG